MSVKYSESVPLDVTGYYSAFVDNFLFHERGFVLGSYMNKVAIFYVVLENDGGYHEGDLLDVMEVAIQLFNFKELFV